MMAGAAARAQVAEVRIDQAEAGSEADAAGQVDVPQLSDRSRTLTGSERSATPARAPQQIGPPEQDARGAPQLTAEPRSTRVERQLSEGGTAREPTPISRPSDGRTSAVARVEGDDRCDEEAKAARPDICDRVIETRSAEFARPDPLVLSPEQRLLIDQRLREAPSMRVAGNRRFDPQANDPNRSEDQAIASVALDRPAADVAADAAAQGGAQGPALPEASAALIEVILNNAGATPPPR